MMQFQKDGTFEAYGEKINGNNEKVEGHWMIRHGKVILPISQSQINFEGLKEFLTVTDIEGIVFHHKSDGRMCKLRKSDYGIKR